MNSPDPHSVTSPGGKEAYISFIGPISIESAQRLVDAITKYTEQGSSSVYLLLGTPGGNVNVGVFLYNTLRSLPVRLITYNMGSVDSIGFLVFLAGEDRYCSIHSRFMLHGVGFDIQGETMRIGEKELNERLESIKNDQAFISQCIEERTRLTSEQLNEFFYQESYLTAVKAKEYGIVQEIRDLQVPPGAPFVQLVL